MLEESKKIMPRTSIVLFRTFLDTLQVKPKLTVYIQDILTVMHSVTLNVVAKSDRKQ